VGSGAGEQRAEGEISRACPPEPFSGEGGEEMSRVCPWFLFSEILLSIMLVESKVTPRRQE